MTTVTVPTGVTIIVHPGPGAYNKGCRCEECKTLHRERCRRIKEDLVARGAADPDLIPHGTIGGYSNWECRCPDCKRANADSSAAWRAAHPGDSP